MLSEDFSNAALVLIGHGSTKNADSGVPVFKQAGVLRQRRLFAEVREAFWKQDPQVERVLPELNHDRIFLVPFFISDGYFSENVIPKALGFELKVDEPFQRVRRSGRQMVFYCRAVGSHPGMTRLLLSRADQVIRQFPFPRTPKPKDISLFIAGHGTEQDSNSRVSVERQLEAIRQQNLYSDVHAVYLEEEPRIASCYETARARNIVLVPFFISDGLHVQEDIPSMLGEPERLVRERLQNGQAPWRNPTEKRGKLVWCASAVGTDPMMSEVILERVREAAQWAACDFHT
ncbi:MAG TPA: CbiX/SirB N-terminal domain-containing protein [Verrucomicrobiae bacterium]|nr:CbiX/SirB N-terminal domain-containing protein [Verrucomicrobiae bacterium]